jgi:vancomycin permeability regulator SanA
MDGFRHFVRRAVQIVLVIAGTLSLYFGVTCLQVINAGRQATETPPIAVAKADAIVILGSAQYDCRPAPVLKARIEHAHDLYVSGVAPVIVVTGGKQDGDRCTEATAQAQYLHDLGVPDDAILREVEGTNTFNSLQAASRFLKDRDLTNVVMVSDPYHSLRLRHIANDVGLSARVSAVPDSPISVRSRSNHYMRETVAVGFGRLIGFGRLP